MRRPLSWVEVRERRLARNHLSSPAPRSRLVDVVRAVGGIHAQVLSAAELALAARVRGLRASDVAAALWDERTLVKTWTLRGTLHLHAADELGLWLAACRAATDERREPSGPPAGELAGALDAVAGALDGRCLTREELAEAVAPHVGAWTREHIASGWGTVLGPAALAGVLVHGPPRGARVTFVRADQWLGEIAAWEPREALAEVLRRYLRAFGPATHREFAAWVAGSHLKASAAAALLAEVVGDLEEVDVEGQRAWLALAEPRRRTPAAPVRLLPEYDAYVMGFREREHLFPPAAVARTRAHGKGRLEGPGALSWLLVDGVVAGTWTRRRAGGRVTLTVDPFEPLDAAQRDALGTEAVRVGALWGLEVELRGVG